MAESEWLGLKLGHPVTETLLHPQFQLESGIIPSYVHMGQCAMCEMHSVEAGYGYTCNNFRAQDS